MTVATYDFIIADVFTDTPFTGNQLAVCPDGASVPEAMLQPLALEIGYSETTFVYADHRVRIFTPYAELPFAGHPVLGTAAVLRSLRPGTDRIDLQTGRGVVPVTFNEAGRGRMVQPIPTWSSWDGDSGDLCVALGVKESVLPIDRYDNGVPHVYVVLDDPDQLAELRPDLGAVEQLVGATGTNVVAPLNGTGTRWKSRMFGPGVGVAEDPATGSAAGPLAVHLARHGRIPWDAEIEIIQGVELMRPSLLYAVARGGPDHLDVVEVAGDTVIVGTTSFT